MKIGEFLDDIRHQNLVVPEFQREYVWSRDQAKQLMDSLCQGYPVGSLLLWKTDNPPELKNIKNLPEKIGTLTVLLDGQQRLTTLYMLINGQIPPYYSEEDIHDDPRNLFVNINDLDLQYYQRIKMRGDTYWWRVVDCFDGNVEINPIQIAQERFDGEGKDPMALAQHLLKNLEKVRRIREIDIPEQIVPVSASLDKAIDIFDRVNSQGTKLTDAELALTHIVSKWPIARREFKTKLNLYSNRGFNFGLDFMTRALTTTVTNRALFEAIHTRPREDLELGWKKLTKILNYLLTILPSNAFINSTNDLNTSNALIPIIAYLSRNNEKFPDDKTTRHAINWLYAALMWTRYSGQTDQKLEADIQLVVRETEPWNALRTNIVEQRGRVEIKESDLVGRGIQNPFYKAMFILAKAHGAVDWKNGTSLGGSVTDHHLSLQSHHIFRQSYLYANGWDSDNYLHRQTVNEIANRVHLTAETSWALSDKRPEEYLPLVEENFPGALSAQFVPLDPTLWKVEHYEEFLKERRKIIARKLNEYMESLIEEPEVTHRRPISELIDLGESYVLEFKSTLQWDVVTGQKRKELRHSSLKTIAAFLNSQGGTLVIGVEDDGKVFGLNRDLEFAQNSSDGFERLLVSLVSESMGITTAPYYRVRFENVENETVCVIEVERSPEPIFMNFENRKVFCIRAGNTTRILDSEETLKYVETNW